MFVSAQFFALRCAELGDMFGISHHQTESFGTHFLSFSWRLLGLGMAELFHGPPNQDETDTLSRAPSACAFLVALVRAISTPFSNCIAASWKCGNPSAACFEPSAASRAAVQRRVPNMTRSMLAVEGSDLRFGTGGCSHRFACMALRCFRIGRSRGTPRRAHDERCMCRSMCLPTRHEAFLAMCRRGEEGYSQTEIVFYGKEVEEVNRALEKKAQERSARREELEAEIDSKRTGPFETFTESFDEAASISASTM